MANSSFERALVTASHRLTGDRCPPRLGRAIRYALFPPGHRFRPLIADAVARSLDNPYPALTHAAGVALEFVHTASLIQDDLPDFDDAWTRRDRPSLHVRFGSATAILASDALIAGAPQIITAAEGPASIRLELVHHVMHAIGSAEGAVAGQAWELEETLDMTTYHAAKTAALFEAATMMGAVAAGREAEEWRLVGYHLGMAYQMADDISDKEEVLQGRPNAMSSLTADTARARCREHLSIARRAVPVEAPTAIHQFIERVAHAFGADRPRRKAATAARVKAVV